MSYYIETSVGNVEFTTTESLEECKMSVYDKEKFKTIIPKDTIMFGKFLDMYGWNSISFVKTDYGYFMNIELDDGYYGSPEYKVHNKE